VEVSDGTITKHFPHHLVVGPCRLLLPFTCSPTDELAMEGVGGYPLLGSSPLLIADSYRGGGGGRGGREGEGGGGG